jgi:eukaryotic-like serine/threonine-protein kinase
LGGQSAVSMFSSSNDYERFDALADEFARRYRQGEKPSLQEYIDRLPAMADEIRELFPALIEVEHVQEARDEREKQGPTAGVAPLSAALGQLGDYRILREVGRGGMGVVYEAEQISLGRRVALKVLPRHVAKDKKTLERFRREARAAARLHHTNIVPVFEVGQDGDVVFYAMQFIQGQGLDRVIDDLAKLRTGSRPGGTGSLPLSDRAPRSSRVGGEIAFGEDDPAAATIADDTPSPTRHISLSRMAHSLLTGRFVIGEIEGSGETPPSTAGVSHAAGQTSAFDPDATAGREGARAQRDQPDAGSAADRRLPRLLQFIEAQRWYRDESAADAHSAKREVESSAVLPGGTLVSSADSSDRRRPFFRSVSQIGRQVALGLAYAHARGIIHRDIKPSNLLLDTAGVVWITDFGLAKADEEGLTASGDILGTLRYMAPERFRGAGDARADVYALGLTLYELLTLRPAFNSSDRLRLIEQVKGEEPVRPRSVDIRIPRDLETIVLKATDKDPDHRYQTAAALAEDLRRFIDDEPIQARRASVSERLGRWARHHKAIAVSLVLFAVLLTSVAIGASIAAARFRGIAADMRLLAGEKEQERSRAVESKAAADAARKLAEEQRETAIHTLYFAKASDLSDSLLTPQGRQLVDPFLMSWRGLNVRNDPRAWEWYYLQSPPAHELLTLRGHRVDVCTVDVSPDGKRIASGGFDDSIRFWDAETGKQVMSIPAALRGVLSLKFSPDGRRIAESSTDHNVRVWDVALGLNLLTMRQTNVYALAWSSDGARLASTSSGEPIRIWDAGSGKLLVKFSQGVYPAACAWSPDGSRVVGSTGNDNVRSVSIWHASTGKRLAEFGVKAPSIGNVAWSPDGRQIACASLHGVIVVIDSDTGQELAVLDGRGGTSSFTPLAWSPDGSRLAAGDDDGRVMVWSAGNRQPLVTLRGTSKAHALAWFPDGRRLVTGHGGWNGEVKVWTAASPRTTTLAGSRPDEPQWGFPLVWSPVRPLIALGNSTGGVDLWDTDKGATRPLPLPREQYPIEVSFSRDGTRLAVGLSGANPFVKVFDVATCREVATLSGVDKVVRSVSWSADGRRLAVGGALFRDFTSKTLIWDTQTWTKIDEFDASTALFSPDGRQLALGSRYLVTIKSAANGQVISSWSHPEGLFSQTCWSPDGRFVAGHYEQHALVWEVATGRLVARLAGHSANVKFVAWSPDGQRLATASDDATVRLWDAQFGTPVFTLRGHDSPVQSVAWSADGLKLASVTRTGSIRLWDATTGSRIERSPTQIPALDARLAADPTNADALRARADVHARLQHWDEAAADYQRLTKLLGEHAPAWFQGGWWSATALKGNSTDKGVRQAVGDPFDTDWENEGAFAGDPARPRWYYAPDDPGGFAPLVTDEPYLMTRFFTTSARDVVLVCERARLHLWLNGQPLKDGAARQAASLREGWNTLIAKCDHSSDTDNSLAQPRSGIFVRFSTEVADLASAHFENNEPEKAVDVAMKALEPAPNDPGLLWQAYRISRECSERLHEAGKNENPMPRQARPLTLLERLIAHYPQVSSLPTELGSLLVRRQIDWEVLETIDMKSNGGATLERLPDGSILASGTNPARDTYTVTAKTRAKRITGFRLEALTHLSLPNGGPGRTTGFRFAVSDLVVRVGRGDGGQEGVRVFGRPLKVGTDTWIAQALDEIGDGSETTITVTIAQNVADGANIGHFRLSVTTLSDFDVLAAILAEPPRTPAASAAAVGAAKLSTGEPRAAIADLERSVALRSGKLVTSELLRYLAHDRIGEASQAGRSLHRALEKLEQEPSDDGLVPVVAAKALSRALESTPDDTRMLGMRAMALARLGRRVPAAADFTRLVKLDPGNSEWPRRLAQFQPAVIRTWNFDFGTEGWTAEGDVKLTAGAGSNLKVESIGDEPQIAATIAAPAGKLKLAIRARVDQPIDAVLYWGEQPPRVSAVSYAKERSRPFELTPSGGQWRDVELEFEPKAPLAGLRLDLGQSGRCVEIDSVVLRSSHD